MEKDPVWAKALSKNMISIDFQLLIHIWVISRETTKYQGVNCVVERSSFPVSA